MSTLDPRDRSLDHLLRQASGPSSASDQCVDGETLAAWIAGSLPTSSATTVEGHLADCARCQALLAAFVRSEPPAVASVTDATRWWPLRWLVPLATAATAVAIWVALPTDVVRSDQRQLAAPSQSLPEAPAASSRFEPSNATEPAPPSSVAEGRAAAGSAPARLGQARADRAVEDSRMAARLPEAKGSRETEQKAKEEADLRTDALKRVPAAGPPPATAKLTAPAEQKPAATEQVGAAAQQREERNATFRAAAPAPPAPLAVSQSDRASTSLEFVSPDPNRRWRIVNGTRIEYSTNAGVAWQPALGPVQGTLVSGATPSATVAWVVGKAGAIFVTTDGTRFERIPFPEAVDLLTVVAVDDRQATVLSADGRRFATRDRGATWESR